MIEKFADAAYLNKRLNEITAAYEKQQEVIAQQQEVIDELKNLTFSILDKNQSIVDDLPF